MLSNNSCVSINHTQALHSEGERLLKFLPSGETEPPSPTVKDNFPEPGKPGNSIEPQNYGPCLLHIRPRYF